MRNCFLLIAFCLSFSVAQAQSNSLEKYRADTFSIAAVPYRWLLEDGQEEVEKVSGNAFKMKAGKGTDLHYPASGAFRRHNAPKALFQPGTDFEFSAKVTPTFDGKYNGGAILLYADTLHWAKILFQYTAERCIIGMSVVENGKTDDSYYPTDEVASIFLQVKKAGAVCSFYISGDGKTWKLTRQFIAPHPERLWAGFYTQAPVAAACTVLFSDISYKEVLK